MVEPRVESAVLPAWAGPPAPELSAELHRSGWTRPSGQHRRFDPRLCHSLRAYRKAAAMTMPQSAQTAPLTEVAVGRQLAELTAALQRAEASHREMQMALGASYSAPSGWRSSCCKCS